MTTAAKTKPLAASWLAALRVIEANDFNPMGRHDGIHSSIGRALLRRGLCERKGPRMPLTAAGCAVLDAVDGPAWSVTMANHLHTPSDPEDEPAFFHHEFRAHSAVEAFAAAVAWGKDAGDCSPSGGVEDVEGPLWAAVSEVAK
jgi:hypothetical protein